MTSPRRLDHVAILVADTAQALGQFRDRLGLELVHQETLSDPPLRLTYLDAGNAFLQLIEPLREDSPAGEQLRDHGEGLHHVCFAMPDPVTAAAVLGDVPVEEIVPGSGRGRVSAFVPGRWHGTRIECTALAPARPGQDG